MNDFWTDAAKAEVAPPPSAGADVPDNLRVLLENCTAANGKAAPLVKPIDGANGTFYKFNCGMIVVGGEEAARKYNGRYVFMDLYIHKRAEDSEKLPLSGALYNLILDMLAPDGGKDALQARWAKVMGRLGAAATEAGYTLEGANGDAQMLYATTFAYLLNQEAFRVVGKTYTPKQREGSTFKPKGTVGSIEAATSDTLTKRKVVVFDGAAPTKTEF